MLIFSLCSTSDDRPCDLSDQSQLKCEKRPTNSSKSEILIFGLHSTFDDLPSDKSLPKFKKRPPKSSQNEMLVFLDYVQILIIGWMIQVMKVDWNAKKGPLSHWKMKCSFLDYVPLLRIGLVIWAMKVDWNAKKGPVSHQKMKVIEKFNQNVIKWKNWI